MRRARVLVALGVVAFAAAFLVAVRMADGKGGGGTVFSATSVASTVVIETTTTSLPGPTATTTGNPNSFTTVTARGPLQVVVNTNEPACVGLNSWRVPYTVRNAGTSREVVLSAKVDDNPPVLVRKRFQLGGEVRGEAIVHTEFGGEGLTLVLTDADGVPITSSFPVMLGECRR